MPTIVVVHVPNLVWEALQTCRLSIPSFRKGSNTVSFRNDQGGKVKHPELGSSDEGLRFEKDYRFQHL